MWRQLFIESQKKGHRSHDQASGVLLGINVLDRTPAAQCERTRIEHEPGWRKDPVIGSGIAYDAAAETLLELVEAGWQSRT
jgi:hypothetical protein